MVESDKGSECQFTVSKNAQLKILLHGAKYPYAEVQGVLIGIGDGKKVEIVDAIPVSHSMMLAPTLETAMVLTEEYCKSSQTCDGAKIVGWYNGPSRANIPGVPKVAQAIAGKIRAKNATDIGTCIILIDASSLAKESEAGIVVYTKKTDSGNWSECSNMKIQDNAASKQFTEMLKAESQMKLCDFDDWFDDTNMDWRNLSLIK